MNDTKLPRNYSAGKRIEQIIDCSLRLEMSNVILGLFNRHLTKESYCVCGYPFEIVERFSLIGLKSQNKPIDTIMHLQNKYSDIRTWLLGDQAPGPNTHSLTHPNTYLPTHPPTQLTN